LGQLIHIWKEASFSQRLPIIVMNRRTVRNSWRNKEECRCLLAASPRQPLKLATTCNSHHSRTTQDTSSRPHTTNLR